VKRRYDAAELNTIYELVWLSCDKDPGYYGRHNADVEMRFIAVLIPPHRKSAVSKKQ
jgi:hypothetical protein